MSTWTKFRDALEGFFTGPVYHFLKPFIDGIESQRAHILMAAAENAVAVGFAAAGGGQDKMAAALAAFSTQVVAGLAVHRVAGPRPDRSGAPEGQERRALGVRCTGVGNGCTCRGRNRPDTRRVIWLSLLSRLLQILGFVRGAAAVWRAHESRVKANEVADAPSTRAELEETLRRGDL